MSIQLPARKVDAHSSYVLGMWTPLKMWMFHSVKSPGGKIGTLSSYLSGMSAANHITCHD